MGRVDRDAAGLFFWRLVNFGVIRELGPALVGENLGDGGGQGRFAMVDVTLGFGISDSEGTREDNYLWSRCSYVALHERTWRQPRQHSPAQELSTIEWVLKLTKRTRTIGKPSFEG